MTKTLLIVILFSLGAMCSDIIDDFLVQKYQFLAIFLVVFLDMIVGIAKALHQGNFETKKTFKGLWMITAFELLLAVLLLIEKGFPFASWISEAVLLPIIVFELISILKNMSLLGLINNTVLSKILKNVDKHKEIVEV
jgi:toxin secretion/phage lysis holin